MNCDVSVIGDRALSESRFLRQAGIVIPTYNAAPYWTRMRAALDEQGINEEQVLIVDSSSTDDTRRLAQRAGYRVKKIPTSSFRHGATRQMAADCLPWAEVLIYLTQDAIPFGADSLAYLLQSFDNPEVGAAYGRQLPRREADPIERHARLFNYPDKSDLRTLDKKKEIGIKAAFFSNSFAAYRRVALEQVDGFPKDTIVSEEVTVAARMLIAKWKVLYQAEATAIHSHPLTLRKEFSRYFDIGVHHGRERWLLDTFGGAGGEGRRFVLSEAKYLMKTKPLLLPFATIRNVSKWCSYQLGLRERFLPESWKEFVSAQPNFWRDQRTAAVAASSRVAMPTS